jgi:hypothetical protein
MKMTKFEKFLVNSDRRGQRVAGYAERMLRLAGFAPGQSYLDFDPRTALERHLPGVEGLRAICSLLRAQCFGVGGWLCGALWCGCW